MPKNKSTYSFLISLFITAFILSGCINKVYTPTMTSLELQQIQADEFETSYKVGFSATMSVFQDLGYIISAADAQTGLISATGPKSMKFDFLMGTRVMKNQKATAFVETASSKMLRIRLNFVEEEEISGSYGEKGASAIPIEDPQLYQDTFERIRKAIFVRSSL